MCITENEKQQVFYDDTYIGKIVSRTPQSLEFISAYVGGYQTGSCLEDIYQFALDYLNKVFVQQEPQLKDKPKPKALIPKRYTESRVRAEAEFFELSPRKVTWFLKKKPPNIALGAYWRAEKLRLIKSYCRGKEDLPRGWGAKALALLGLPKQSVPTVKKLKKILKRAVKDGKM